MVDRRDVLLVAGNGLAIDRRATSIELAAWDTQRPLAWEVPNPSGEEVLIDALPHVKASIQALRASRPGLRDFELFEELVRSLNPKGALGNAPGIDIHGIVELRHLVVQSFVRYDAVAASVDSTSWEWGNWIRSNVGRLLGAVSFSYELALERLIEAAGRSVRHAAIVNEPGDFVMFKPHGSIDYAPAQNVIGGQAPSYPLQIFMEKNDMPLMRLPRSELGKARYAADIVVPGELSGYREFQWVKPGREWARMTARSARYIVMLGLSYWPVDRPELDEITNAADPSATIIMANPYPDEDWLDMLRARFGSVVLWKAGPEALPT